MNMFDKQRVRTQIQEITDELEGERTRLSIQGRALTPEEQETLEQVTAATPYTRRAAEALSPRNGGGAASEIARAADSGDLLDWGGVRHRSVGEAAHAKLQSANAKSNVARILQVLGASHLGTIANWADAVKDWRAPKPTDDPNTAAFFRDPRNEANWTWHFVNLPLEAQVYDPQQLSRFVRDDDVVRMIVHSIRSLKQPGDAARFSEANALRLLVHLVGDLHQPIHIGSGYIANPDSASPRLVRSIADASAPGAIDDQGGGLITLENGRKLHGYWDSGILPDSIGDGLFSGANDSPGVVANLARSLAGAQTETPRFADANDLERQPLEWTRDSLEAARSAYEGFVLEPHSGSARRYRVKWPQDEQTYIATNGPKLRRQMELASTRLAALLDAIWP
jgi:hypothetical protein